MKTSNFNFRNLTSKISILVLLVTAFLTSCEKDQLPPAAGQASQNIVNEKKVAAPYAIVSIDHNGPQDDLVSYKVQMMSNNIVIFEGRKNTNFIGTFKISIDAETAQKAIDLFEAINFNSIEQIPPIKDDQPSVITSYATSRDKKEIRTDDLSQPQHLVSLRTAAEDVLGIGYMIVEQQ